MSTESVESMAIRARGIFFAERGQAPVYLYMSPRTYARLCREMESLRGYAGVGGVSRLLGCEVISHPACPDDVVLAQPLVGEPRTETHSTDSLAYATAQILGQAPPRSRANWYLNREDIRSKDPLKDPAFLAEVRRIESLPRPGVEKTLPWYGDDQIAADTAPPEDEEDYEWD